MSWTESVYLDCVSPDGTTGFVARLARHVDEGTSWLWAHAFRAGEVVAYHDQSLPCAGGASAVEEADAAYEQPGMPRASFRRQGERGSMSGAALSVEVLAHRDPYAPAGSGSVPLRIEAEFTPARVAGGTLPGRTEVLGEVRGRFSIDDREHTVTGGAQWHEQHQTAPRFTVPFTYATLRGATGGAVLLRGPQRSGGLLWRGQEPELVVELGIEPPGRQRALTLTMGDGGTVEGTLTTTHDYAVEIDGFPRPGTLVAGELAGMPVSGCINHWVPAPAEAGR